MKNKQFLRTSTIAALGCISLGGMMIASDAQAQTVPGSADVSRVQERIGADNLAARPEAPLDIKGNAPFDAPAGAEAMLFTLQKVDIEGQTVYPWKSIEKLYADKIGTKISLADVYSLAAQMTAQYRNDGYILTQVVVPPQTIANGTIKLRVVEGAIDQITIQDQEGNSSYNVINLYAQELKTKTVLNNKDLERALLLMNDIPGVTARGVLSPSQNKVGTSDLTIIIERDPFEAELGLDNYGSRYLGRWEGTGGMAFNSLLGLNERLSFNMAYAPSGKGVESELAFGEVMAEVPIGKYGTLLTLTAGRTHTEPGHTLDQFDVKGRSTYAELNVIQPFVRTRDFNVSASLGFDMRRTRTKSNIEATREDDISVVRFGAHTDWIDTALNAAITNIDMTLSKGVSAFGSSDENDPNLSRPSGDPEFTKITGSISRLERIIDKVALQTSIKGQMSNAALLSSEEFGIGGSAFGRGYDSSELVGDDGLAASIELQWNQPVPTSFFSDYTLYGFYDVGRVWNDDATTVDGRAESLASVGLGLRATIVPGTDAGLMVALPLTRNIEAENDDDIRPFLSINHKF